MSVEYDVIRDAIDAQNNLDVDKSIQKLQKKKAQLIDKIVESTLMIKNSRRQTYRIFQRRFFSFDESSRRRFKVITKKIRDCFFCDDSHKIVECNLLKTLKK